MSQQRVIPWYDLDKQIQGLITDEHHEILVRREAIPIIFVPGIMGSRLQRKGASRFTLKKRWDPNSKAWMATFYLGADGATRKNMLVGDRFDSNYLEVIKDKGETNGFEGIFSDYHGFLNQLKEYDWGPVAKIFELPVYACGFNWTARVEDSGKKLAQRIDEIIKEARAVTGLCEKVILITHSMGGLVARWASECSGASGNILGIIHGVQPVTGSPAGYWRIKGGFEGDKATSLTLGPSAREVTPILGNIPGGLSLLPNTLYRTNNGDKAWLTVTENGVVTRLKPRANAYDEIYRIPAVVAPRDGDPPGENPYWGLVDPELLDPGNTMPGGSGTASNDINAIDARTGASPWDVYKDVLQMAEDLHSKLSDKHHELTFCSQGKDFPTADTVELRIESRSWHTFRNYTMQGFRGFLRNANGDRMQAVLQDPAGGGDGTVPSSSSGALNKYTRLPPNHREETANHQAAYQVEEIQDFTVAAILALCRKRYKDKHG